MSGWTLGPEYERLFGDAVRQRPQSAAGHGYCRTCYPRFRAERGQS